MVGALEGCGRQHKHLRRWAIRGISSISVANLQGRHKQLHSFDSLQHNFFHSDSIRLYFCNFQTVSVNDTNQLVGDISLGQIRLVFFKGPSYFLLFFKSSTHHIVRPTRLHPFQIKL